MTPYRSPDGTWWGAEVRMPSHSGAMVIFHHPTGETTMNVRSAVAQDPRERLSASTLAASLTDGELAKLFRRSAPVSTDRPTYIVS